MTLALLGGSPLRRTPFPAWPHFDDCERTALQRALEQGQWWRMHGSENDAFEAEFAEFHGTAHAITVTNGTHALEVALMAAGIGPGDEVLVPGFTFISTSMAVQRVGAVAIPVDVDLETYCMLPECAEKAVSARTRALIPVHMGGHFADMERLGDLARRHGLALIQDAAHAHGACGPDGRRVGEWGSVACFSFQNFKLMTAGEGGAILFPDAESRERAFLYVNCGRPKGDLLYRHMVSGSNYRLGEFNAAVLRCQLRRLAAQTATREANAAVAEAALGNIDGIVPQGRTGHAVVHPHYMLMFRLDRRRFPDLSRDRVVEALVAEGVPAFRNYKAIYRIEAFHQPPAPAEGEAHWAARCPNTELIAGDGIWIHHRALLGSAEDARDIARAVEKVLAKADTLSDGVRCCA